MQLLEQAQEYDFILMAYVINIKEKGDLIAICDTNQISMDYNKNFILRKFSSNKIKTYHPGESLDPIKFYDGIR